MIHGVVYVAPMGTRHPGLEFHTVGVVTEASVQTWGGGPRTFHLTVEEQYRTWSGPSLQEQADQLAAEEIARTLPGAAGW